MRDSTGEAVFELHGFPIGEQFRKGGFGLRKGDLKRQSGGVDTCAGHKARQEPCDVLGRCAPSDQIDRMGAGRRRFDGRQEDAGDIVGMYQVDLSGEGDCVGLAQGGGTAGQAGTGGDTDLAARTVDDVGPEGDRGVLSERFLLRRAGRSRSV